MAEDVVALSVRYDSDGKTLVAETGDIERAFRRLDDQKKKNQRGFKNLTTESNRFRGSLGALRGVATAAAGAIAALGVGLGAAGFARTLVETDRLRASLRTVTGSSESAAKAFTQLEGIARQLPFTLDQSVTTFIRMKSLGLDPTEEALLSFGNTASAMGKDLLQFTEAVADAATNEFERLKEFGIRASQDAESVTFTFQGVETKVAKSADAIVGYLTSIGAEGGAFFGAAEDQMRALPGLVSNLQDAIGGLFREIGDSGATDNLRSGLEGAIGAVEGLTEAIPGLRDEMEFLTDVATIMAAAFGTRLLVPALLRAATAMRGAASAAAILSGTVAALGGPVGLAVVAGTAMLVFADNAETSAERTARVSEEVDRLIDRFDTLSEKAQESQRASIAADLAAAEQRLGELQRLAEESVVGGRSRAAQRRFLPEQIEAVTEEVRVLRDAWLELNGITEITIEGFEKVEGRIGKPLRSASSSSKELAKEIKRLRKEWEDGAKSLAKTGDELDAYNKTVRDLIENLFPLKKAQREYTEELELLDRAFKQGSLTSDEYAEALRRLRERHSEIFPEVQRSKEQADELARAWVTATERIDSAFADAWKGAFDGFGEFAKNLFGAFKQLLAEMAHLAITRPILVNLGLLGPGTAGAATSLLSGGNAGGGGFGGAGGILGGLGALGGGINQGLLTARSTILGGLNNLGLSGAANFFGQGTANIARLGGGFGIGGGLALTGLAGLGGGLLGNELFGASGIGSAVGGVGGALLGAQFGALGGPIGSFVGALVGSLVDSVIGGDGKKRFVTGVATGDSTRPNAFRDVTTESGLRLRAVENRAGEEGRKAASSLLDTLVGLDAALTALTGADLSGRSLAGQSGQAGVGGTGDFFGVFGFNGEAAQGSTLEDAANRFVKAWLDEVNDQLPQRVRDLTTGIEGTAEALVGALEAAVSIDRLLGLDVVQRTEEAFRELGRKLEEPLITAYDDLTEAVLEAAAGLDGSTDSLLNLNNVLSQQKSIAADLAAAYKAVGIEIDAAIGNTIQNIRESILNEEELYNLRRQQIADITSRISETVDPDVLRGLGLNAERLIAEVFGGLTPDQQEAQAAAFIETLQELQSLLDQQISLGESQLAERERGVLQSVDVELATLRTTTQGVSGQFQELGDELGGFLERLRISSAQLRDIQESLAVLQASGGGVVRQ